MSLDTLDASLYSRNRCVPGAEATRSFKAKQKGSWAKKLSTSEFLFYLISVLAIAWMMLKTGIEFSQESHPNYHKFSHLLQDGWIPGRKVDISDFQYAHFRKHLFKFVVLSIFHPFSRWAHDFAFSFLGNKYTNRQKQHSLRMHRRTQFDVIFGLIFISVLHGVAAVNLMFFVLANYGIIRFCSHQYIPVATWAMNIGILFARDYPTITVNNQEFSALWMSQQSIFMQWSIRIVQFKGLMPGWKMLIKASVLRMISFNMDYYWSVDANAAHQEMIILPHRVSTSNGNPIQVPKKSVYNIQSYVAYVLYTPLYISGPIMTFDGYIIQQFFIQPSTSWVRTTLYGIRLLFALLCVEIMLHYIYVNAILKASPEWLFYTPFQLSMLAYFKLKFTWLKLLIIWRFSRFWALVDGIDPPENLIRCMTNNYSVLGFWRGWHRSFNRWIIRYIYLPAGGGLQTPDHHANDFRGNQSLLVKARRFGILLLVFTFSAIWHDINPRLLLWGWLTTIFLLPETLLSSCTSLNNWLSQKPVFRFIVSIGGAVNIIIMIFANLVGFAGQGSDLKGFLYEIIGSWAGWSFLFKAILGCSMGVQLMLEVRNKESREGIHLRC